MKRLKLVLATLLLINSALADDKGKNNRVDGKHVSQKIEKLRDINWHFSLKAAKETASNEKKPIFWLHSVGELFGTTWSASQSLRAVTLSADKVFPYLKDNFICGYRNIQGESFSGVSSKNDIDGIAFHTTNGAGSRNTQIFILTPDGTVLHCLPGFWAPNDFILEVSFAIELSKIWNNKDKSEKEKHKAIKQAHLDHIKCHSNEMSESSRLQSFDAAHEYALKESEFKFSESYYQGVINDLSRKYTNLKRMPSIFGGMTGILPKHMKCCDEIMHKRMAKMACVSYENFEIEKFAFGRKYYALGEDSLNKAKYISYKSDDDYEEFTKKAQEHFEWTKEESEKFVETLKEARKAFEEFVPRIKEIVGDQKSRIVRNWIQTFTAKTMNRSSLNKDEQEKILELALVIQPKLKEWTDKLLAIIPKNTLKDSSIATYITNEKLPMPYPSSTKIMADQIAERMKIDDKEIKAKATGILQTIIKLKDDRYRVIAQIEALLRKDEIQDLEAENLKNLIKTRGEKNRAIEKSEDELLGLVGLKLFSIYYKLTNAINYMPPKPKTDPMPKPFRKDWRNGKEEFHKDDN